MLPIRRYPGPTPRAHHGQRPRDAGYCAPHSSTIATTRFNYRIRDAELAKVRPYMAISSAKRGGRHRGGVRRGAATGTSRKQVISVDEFAARLGHAVKTRALDL